MEVVASLSQGRTAAAQCGLFTHKSVPVKFEPPCKRKRLPSHMCLSDDDKNTLFMSQNILFLTLKCTMPRERKREREGGDCFH